MDLETCRVAWLGVCELIALRGWQPGVRAQEVGRVLGSSMGQSVECKAPEVGRGGHERSPDAQGGEQGGPEQGRQEVVVAATLERPPECDPTPVPM